MTKYEKLPIVCPNPPKIKKLELDKILWVVALNEENGLKVIGLSSEDYELLAKNTSKLYVLITQQKRIIKYYRECIKKFNENKDLGNLNQG